MKKIRCEQCGNFILETRFLCGDCFKEIANSYWKYKPSTVEEVYCDDIFPKFILETMPDYLIKDINEIFRLRYII